jgi:hypothetical protein
MTFHNMPAQVSSGQDRAGQFHDFAYRLGTDFRHVQQVVETSWAQEFLTLVAGRRHKESVGHRPVILTVQVRQAAQERAVEIVALRQVDDNRTRSELGLERLRREFTEGWTLRKSALALNKDEKARGCPSASQHRSLRVDFHGSRSTGMDDRNPTRSQVAIRLVVSRNPWARKATKV